MNNFLEIKNATFKAGGKEKIKNLSIEIKNEGDIVCFPSYIWHRVKPLKSGRRFVVSGNIEIQHQDRNYWDLDL